MAEAGPHIRITRSDDGSIVWLWINGATHTFSRFDWAVFQQLQYDWACTKAKSMQNFADLPTRTPLHANTPRKQPSADDLA